MKLYFLVFAIVVMVQASVAEPISRRHKRSELFVDIFQETITAIKQILPTTEAILKKSLKEIPATPAYVKYVQLFEAYLTKMEESKKTRGNCFKKNMVMIEKFVKFVEKIDVNTPEGKDVDRILDNNGGIEMVKDVGEFVEKLNSPAAETVLEDATHEDAIKIIPLLIEEC